MNIKDKIHCVKCYSTNIELVKHLDTYVWEDEHHEHMRNQFPEDYDDTDDSIAYSCSCNNCHKLFKVRLHVKVEIEKVKIQKEDVIS